MNSLSLSVGLGLEAFFTFGLRNFIFSRSTTLGGTNFYPSFFSTNILSAA